MGSQVGNCHYDINDFLPEPVDVKKIYAAFIP